jgi:acyl CoA:acetate/3-ketoacid CoA transferase beta subunit
MFDWVWSGRRHVIMGATQIDRFGNQNFAGIGDPQQPKVQLLGYRGAPGNTINDTTSYWIPNHNPKVFVGKVDTVTGVGWDRAEKLGLDGAARFFEVRRVVTNLATLDFDTPDHTMRLRTLHPGVTVDEVVAATGFDLVVPNEVPESRLPSPDELQLLREVIDPAGRRQAEVPDPS